jgi:hypothetical protein
MRRSPVPAIPVIGPASGGGAALDLGGLFGDVHVDFPWP